MIEPILKALVKLFALISNVHDFQIISGREREIVRFFLARQGNSILVKRRWEIDPSEYFKRYYKTS